MCGTPLQTIRTKRTMYFNRLIKVTLAKCYIENE